MRLLPCLTLLCLSCLVAGCVTVASEPAFTLEDDPASLTSAGDDLLFSLTYLDADPLPAERLEVQVTIDGTINAMPFTIDPADGEVATGDLVLVNEPGVDLLGADAEGKTFAVSVVLKEVDDPSRVVELFNGSWEP